MRAPDELRELVERLARVDRRSRRRLSGLSEPMRYALAGGGKRIRPVLCLATAEAAGGRAEDALRAAVALELVHTFSLVHDDLPSMDDDDERRGRPSAHVAHGEGVALLAGDALLTEGLRLALSYERPEPARELADATLGMIGGQYLDVTEADVDARRPSPAQDGKALRRRGRARALGGGRAGGRAGAVAGLRRGARRSSSRPSTT